MSYQRLTALRAMKTRAADPSRAWESALHIQRLIGLAARIHLPAMTCLQQSLTLRWMLNERGIPAAIQIGVQKTSDKIHAHAWVEVFGKTPGETEETIRQFSILNSRAVSVQG